MVRVLSLYTYYQYPRWLITDKLGSYSAAHRRVMPSVVHDTRRWANSRAEVSSELSTCPGYWGGRSEDYRKAVARTARQDEPLTQVTAPKTVPRRNQLICSGRPLR